MMRQVNFTFWMLCVAAAMIASSAGTARAQLASPEVGYVYPAGGQQGTTFQVTVGGQRLRGAMAAVVSGQGVNVKVVEVVPPVNGKMATELREKLAELRNIKNKDDQTRQQILDAAKKLIAFNRRTSPAIAETVVLEVTIASDAAPGRRELRLGTPTGMTNPIVFCVGQLPECREVESQELKDLRAFIGNRYGVTLKKEAAEDEMAVTAPTTINGQIMPGDVDRYRFSARKGQRIVVDVQARQLVPYLADAVPGWFQATIALYDARGRELAFQDDFRFRPDPLLCHEVAADGEYVIEIRDAIYRGREDFVYRIELGEVPRVTGIFPLGGPAGKQTGVELTGWNLPAARIDLEARKLTPGVHSLIVGNATLQAPSRPIAVGDLPECMEAPGEEPQAVSLPIIVNGRIERPGDRDVFTFTGKAGDRIAAEVMARRLDSPLDSVLTLTDVAGKQIALNDDYEDRGAGLETHHADSLLIATLPADGTYQIHLGDVQGKGGEEFGYRLRISPPQPGFELRVTPSCINARGGTPTEIIVHALRLDGFAGAIDLALQGVPAGYVLDGGHIPAGVDRARMTLSTPPKPTAVPLPLKVVGRATVDGKQVTREAVPADDMMQAFLWRHLVPADELTVFVSRRWMARQPTERVGKGPARLPAGGTAAVRVKCPAAFGDARIDLEPSDPPEGVAIGKVTAARGVIEFELKCDAAKRPAGTRGNLIVNAFVTRPTPDKDGKPQPPRRSPFGVLPAIPFEVVAP